jgi:hypothetical protein
MTPKDDTSKPRRRETAPGKLSETTRAGAFGEAGGTPEGPPELDARVQLRRTELPPQHAQTFWAILRHRTIDFTRYKTFIDGVMCCTEPLPTQRKVSGDKEASLDLRLPFPGVRAYNLLKLATELYLMQECGVVNFGSKSEEAQFTERFDSEIDTEADRMGRRLTGDALLEEARDDYLVALEGEVEPSALPYLEVIRRKLKEIPLKQPSEKPPNCYGILRSKLSDPCLLELIWSYWHEEGMLVQSMNAISRRFQNLRSTAANDPLGNLEIDPLRPLNNLLWGYIQDEQHRLSLTRRVYEYDHHYGLRLIGKAVPELRPADSRSKFLEAFHHLLYACTIFFQQDDDTTVISDGFPVLNALREVHLILAQGAHNQFGDLPSNARQEMLIQEWLLARPEIREFLRGRIMVPYPEPWMDAVDHLKKIQGWTDISVREFRDLGVFGEQLLLSIRYDNWGSYNDANLAKSWARYWRQEIQRYIHAYRAVTGVDLSQEPVNATMPGLLLKRRLVNQANAVR